MRLARALLLLGTIVGCGGNVSKSSENSQSNAAGGSVTDPAGTSGTASGSGGGSAGGVGNDPQTTGSSGAGFGGSLGSCALTQDRTTVRVKRGDSTVSCENNMGQPVAMPATVISGVVTQAARTSFTVDTCPPNADCAKTLVTFEVTAPDLSIPISVGALVQVEYSIKSMFGCLITLKVVGIPDWGGMQNPYGPDRTQYLTVDEGGNFFSDPASAVKLVSLGPCGEYAGMSCGGPTPGLYALSFDLPRSPGQSLVVHMGETKEAPLQPAGVSGTIAVRNLRSYQTDLCDDYGNWAYYMVWLSPTR